MIPEKFTNRMREMLGADFAAFEAALEAPAIRALRVNTIKTNSQKLIPLLPFAVKPLPFALDAYYAPSDKVGALSAHHAGMFYMQDPSAICTVCAATPKKGVRAIDLCAAPGGKSTQLAAAIGDTGVLVSNEYVTVRCRILQGNVERIGAKNTVVTNLSTDALASFYGACFDLVVADVPCSGEGMFRKYEVASEEWSPENVQMCAARQRDILENAAALVTPGGQLLYSTCTFSLEENEQNIDAFLSAHPDFSLIPVASAIASVTANGINFDGAAHDLSLCRRFYPHLSPGEGQFVALLQKSADTVCKKAAKVQSALPLPDAKTLALTRAFLSENLEQMPEGVTVTLLRDTLWLTPDLPIPSRGVFCSRCVPWHAAKGTHRAASPICLRVRQQLPPPRGAIKRRSLCACLPARRGDPPHRKGVRVRQRLRCRAF